jgi:four helix bundle protein
LKETFLLWYKFCVTRKNINRGFKQLRVWQDSISLYLLAFKLLSKFPFELKKIAANSIDAAHSISRNIAEGYCRRSIKEYLNYLNIALGSCGEFHSCYELYQQDGITLQLFLLCIGKSLYQDIRNG